MTGRDGYRESISKGLDAVYKLGRNITMNTGDRETEIPRLRREIEEAEFIVIGAGAGLSTSAGLIYSGERFEKYFYDFAEAYGITDMYSGGFYPFPDAQTRWAWWARHIYFNRYVDAPKPVYRQLLDRMKDRNYFVITTNVDHQFQRAGLDKSRLFYTQGDYGLFQSVDPAWQETYDNEEWVMKAMEAQGFVRNDQGEFAVPEGASLCMRIPAELIPKSPRDGSEVTMNLRSDDTFVEDAGWHRASESYSEFLQRLAGRRVLFLELGVGANTPVIIKYPFWAETYENPKATYACLNYNEAFCPKKIEKQSICIDGDIGEVLDAIGEVSESAQGTSAL
ncbi:MAG: hypothetical protein IJ109_08885 [Firmicutes bacterium]|nr:hypothetical protein [Bacillota bacterium]